MPSINTLHCLIFESKTSLRYIPEGVAHYFINSKRRFFVYFKVYEQMLDTMQILTNHGVRFARRQSLLPDREQQEEYVYHCNYRFKKQDLRKNLHHSTPYNDPKVNYDRYDQTKIKISIPQKTIIQPENNFTQPNRQIVQPRKDILHHTRQSVEAPREAVKTQRFDKQLEAKKIEAVRLETVKNAAQAEETIRKEAELRLFKVKQILKNEDLLRRIFMSFNYAA